MLRAVLLIATLLLPHLAWCAESDIELSVRIKAPPAAVWQAWTTSAGITSFFAPEAEIDPRPDGAFHVFIDPYAEPGMKGADDMRFLGLDKEKMLSFTWNAPPSLPQARQQRTVVILRFAAEGDATRLTLSHVGWGESGEWPKARAYFAKAWPHVLQNLQQRFETGQPQDWTEWRANLQKMHTTTTAPAPATPGK